MDQIDGRQIPASQTDLQEAVEEIKKEIGHLPTKEEFFAKEDEVIKELKAVRQEQSAIIQLVRRHDERITKLEGRTGIGSVAVA